MPRVHQRFGIGQTESVFKNNSDKEAWLISFRMRLQGSVETTAAPRKCLILSPAWAERNLAERGIVAPICAWEGRGRGALVCLLFSTSLFPFRHSHSFIRLPNHPKHLPTMT